MKDEFYFPSKDGNTEIHTVEWKPEGDVKAVLQLCHGMVEYINRYSEFAEYLCERGYYVVGNDHLGHGKSVQCKTEYGFFEEKHGNACILGDMHTLHERCRKKYPDVPYFILGHSMGSIMTRQYIQLYGNELSGVILMGVVADQSPFMIRTGMQMCKVAARIRGWHCRSKLIDKMAIGQYNKKFKPVKTRADWVTSDPQKLMEYVQDPLCSFVFTVNAYYHMFSGLLQLQKRESVFAVPKKLSMIFMAGLDDPVGNFGTGVRKIYERYKKAGIEDISLRLYSSDRHELLNETDRQQVYKDIAEWLDAKV